MSRLAPSLPISSLFVIKAIAAYVVVACHIPNGWLTFPSTPIFVSAVPLFYMITGYFLYSTDPKRATKRMLRGARKALILAIAFNLFYFLWILPRHGNVIDSWDKLLDLILYGSALSVQLWYLSALFYGLLIFATWTYLFKGRGVALLIIPIILNYLGGRYHFLAPETFEMNVFSTLPHATPFLAIGYLMRQYQEQILRFQHWGIASFATLALYYVEWHWLHSFSTSIHGIYLTTTPWVICLFALSLQHPTWGRGSLLEEIGKKHSANVYFFHVAVGSALFLILQQIDLGKLYSDYLGSLITFLASVAFSIVLQWGWGQIRRLAGR